MHRVMYLTLLPSRMLACETRKPQHRGNVAALISNQNQPAATSKMPSWYSKKLEAVNYRKQCLTKTLSKCSKKKKKQICIFSRKTSFLAQHPRVSIC